MQDEPAAGWASDTWQSIGFRDTLNPKPSKGAADEGRSDADFRAQHLNTCPQHKKSTGPVVGIIACTDGS